MDTWVTVGDAADRVHLTPAAVRQACSRMLSAGYARQRGSRWEIHADALAHYEQHGVWPRPTEARPAVEQQLESNTLMSALDAAELAAARLRIVETELAAARLEVKLLTRDNAVLRQQLVRAVAAGKLAFESASEALAGLDPVTPPSD